MGTLVVGGRVVVVVGVGSDRRFLVQFVLFELRTSYGTACSHCREFGRRFPRDLMLTSHLQNAARKTPPANE